ncbi:MAG TPA: cytochrome c peroxidase [Polyangiaceae bacterium]|nr:cytochrome c peroxidase [Polyangiaceae bacterium]
MAALAACAGQDPSKPATQTEPPSAPLIESQSPAGFPLGTIVERAPPENRLTEPRAQLGKRLFFDPRLSRDGEVACATCHEQGFAFAEADRVSTGVDQLQGTRNAPALLNLAWGESFFWDGRARSLEEQAGQPIENPIEMDLSLSEAVMRVTAEPSYVEAFAEAYSSAPSEESLRRALASFVRTLVSSDSPYDRHLRGDDAAFGAAEARGEALFLSEKAGCFHCHPAGMLTNEGFFNNGSYDGGEDTGRALFTARSGDIGKFKVPGLRNIDNTAPYMHDGSIPTLEAVIEQYDRGGRGDPNTDPQIVPLALTADEKADLLAFLRSLSDPAVLVDRRYQP